MSPKDIPPYPGDESKDKMAPRLVINDGIPWYVSNDIWVVPGNNPNSLPGAAQANWTNWVWARVWNDGNAPIFNATVNFYWADPSTIITRQNATLIGSEYVSIPAKQYKHIYCHVPWQPVLLHPLHVCLIVEAYDPILDPLPYPGSPDLNFTIDRHVAQHNLILAQNAADMSLVYQISIANPVKEAKQMVEVAVERYPVTNLTGLAMFTGLAPLKEVAQAKPAEILGWSPKAGDLQAFNKAMKAAMVAREGNKPIDQQPRVAQPKTAHAALTRLRKAAQPVQRIEMRPNEMQHLALVIPPLPEANSGEACAYTVTQKINGIEMGGVLVLVMADPLPLLSEHQRRNMLLEQRLSERPDILLRMLDEPAKALGELGLTLEDLQCPEQVAESTKRAEQAAAAVREIEHLTLAKRLPRIGKIAKRYLGDNFRVEKVPFGLQFLESSSSSSNSEWTGTGTIICTFHPGCGPDNDG
jgi:hypothetical protein